MISLHMSISGRYYIVSDGRCVYATKDANELYKALAEYLSRDIESIGDLVDVSQLKYLVSFDKLKKMLTSIDYTVQSLKQEDTKTADTLLNIILGTNREIAKLYLNA